MSRLVPYAWLSSARKFQRRRRDILPLQICQTTYCNLTEERQLLFATFMRLSLAHTLDVLRRYCSGYLGAYFTTGSPSTSTLIPSSRALHSPTFLQIKFLYVLWTILSAGQDVFVQNSSGESILILLRFRRIP